MKIEFTSEEVKKYLEACVLNDAIDSLCRDYELRVVYKDAEYDSAKYGKLGHEESLLAMLNDGSILTFYDGKKKLGVLSLATFTAQAPNVRPLRHLLDMVEETHDATTFDVFLQYAILGDIVYG